MTRHVPSLAGALAALAVFGLAEAAPAAEPAKVTIGVIGILAEAGLYVAQEQGFFAEEGLDVDFKRGIFGPDGFPALATGRLDAMGGAFGPETVNAVQRGIEVKLVLGMNSYIKGWDAGYLSVRKALIDEGRVKDWPDLKGLKIALSPPQPNITDFFATRYLALGGLTLADVTTVNVPFDQMITALKTGGVDAAHTSEPLTTIAVLAGATVKWRPVTSYAPPGLTVAFLHFGPSLLEKSPDMGKHLITGYLRGARQYDEWLKTPEGKGKAADILIKYTPVKDRGLYDKITWAYAPPNGDISVSGLQDMANYFASHAGPNAGDVHKLLDDRFREAALAKLGTVKE
ncbi:MAG TPA: ABC transporter substrate-binding protein [Stellaceae bacterium]|nr:ABC transporter substrate-binding protein [Stellaceae bacterium]